MAGRVALDSADGWLLARRAHGAFAGVHVSWSEKQRLARQARIEADPARRERERARNRERHARKVEASGRAYVPRPPRGPADAPHYIPEGHELAGVSTLTDADGTDTAQWSKTRVAGADPTPLPEGFGAPSRVSRMSRPDGSTVVEWATYERAKAELAAAHVDAWAAHARTYAGLAAPVNAPADVAADLCAVYPLGDPHIGMLAWAPETGAHFDVAIATRELGAAMRELVARTPPAERAIVIQLGDFFHAEDERQATPGHGHKLDVDGRVSRVREAGYTLMRTVVDLALTRHRHVEVVNLPGNHDPNQAHAIAMWLAAVYEREPRVTIDRSCSPYFYREFGTNLIAACHGDGAKGKDLPLLMAARRAEAWGRTRHRVWHVGHVHHTDLKEYAGARVWYHNTLAGKDYWHYTKGYDAAQCLESVTYHRDFGQDSTATMGIERVRAALKATP
jgi:hypothetical protein